MVEIRPLGEADWPAFRQIRLEALREAPEAFSSDYESNRDKPDAEWISRVGPTPDLFVLGAFRDGQIVGLAGFRRENMTKLRHKADVWGVFVSPGARGLGLGRRLMTELISRARAVEGVEQLLLTVVSDNEPARQLYLSLGFTPFGREPRAMRLGDRYLDEDFMILPLHP